MHTRRNADEFKYAYVNPIHFRNPMWATLFENKDNSSYQHLVRNVFWKLPPLHYECIYFVEICFIEFQNELKRPTAFFLFRFSMTLKNSL